MTLIPCADVRSLASAVVNAVILPVLKTALYTGTRLWQRHVYTYIYIGNTARKPRSPLRFTVAATANQSGLIHLNPTHKASKLEADPACR